MIYQECHVELANHSYPIYIGTKLITHRALLTQHIAAEQALIVTNTVVAPLYLEQLQQILSLKQCQVVILPDGEKHKNQYNLNLIYEALIQHRHHRDTTLIALGGGVVGDITGFAAATYQRGVRFIQLPTTLLAQVDAAIGGKTGINYLHAKNMIGSFYQPHAVCIDLDTLATLPLREFRAGLAEIIKYGLLTGEDFLLKLKTLLKCVDDSYFQARHSTTERLRPATYSRGSAILFDARENCSKIVLGSDEPVVELTGLRDNLNIQPTQGRSLQNLQPAWAELIAHCCQIKAAFIQADERENGSRALLNLGHTFAHALEAYTNYQRWLHGEAVAIGLYGAALLSHHLGYLNRRELDELDALLIQAKLPRRIPTDVDIEKLYLLLWNDKKIKNQCLRFILIRHIGDCFISDGIKESDIRRVLHMMVE